MLENRQKYNYTECPKKCVFLKIAPLWIVLELLNETFVQEMKDISCFSFPINIRILDFNSQ